MDNTNKANVDRDDYQVLVDMVDDAVAYACDEAFSNGRLLSGETAWNIVWARATAKVLEFEGVFVRDGETVKIKAQMEEEETIEDNEHF